MYLDQVLKVLVFLLASASSLFFILSDEFSIENARNTWLETKHGNIKLVLKTQDIYLLTVSSIAQIVWKSENTPSPAVTFPSPLSHWVQVAACSFLGCSQKPVGWADIPRLLSQGILCYTNTEYLGEVGEAAVEKRPNEKPSSFRTCRCTSKMILVYSVDEAGVDLPLN